MSDHDAFIYSDRLLNVQYPCPECGEPLRPTGNMMHLVLPGPSTWTIEFECPRERIIFKIHDVSFQPLIDSILSDQNRT
jgi:hypothetical protein